MYKIILFYVYTALYTFAKIASTCHLAGKKSHRRQRINSYQERIFDSWRGTSTRTYLNMLVVQFASIRIIHAAQQTKGLRRLLVALSLGLL